MMAVVVVLGQLLGLKEALPDLRQHLVTAPQKVPGRLGLSRGRINWKNRQRLASVDHLKRRGA